MPGKVDEKKWDAAKAAAKKQYPDWGEDNPRFWKVVSSIYKKMGGEFHSKTEKSMAFLEALERITPTFIADQHIWVKALAKSGITDLAKAVPGEILPRVPMLLRTYAEMGGQLQKSSMLDSIETKTAAGIAEQFEKGGEAPGHKYVRRVARPGGGFRYVYSDGSSGAAPPQAPGQSQSKPAGEAKKMPAKPQTAAARVIAHLTTLGGKKARAALQNVSYEHLRLLETHTKGNEGLQKIVREEVSRRKADAAKKFQAKKTGEKSQGSDPEFQDFYKSFYPEVRDSLMKSPPDWGMGVLKDRVDAQLKLMFKMRG